MKREPMVSVILATRNRAGLLTRCLESVLHQTLADLEVVVVDDGSEDHTWGVLSSIAAADGRVRSCRNATPVGAAAARNLAVRHSKGSIIAFIDDDTVWSSDRLQVMTEAMGRCDSNVAIAYAPYESVELGGRRLVLGGSEGPTPYGGAWQVGTVAVVARKDAFLAVDGFDEGLPRLQDFDLWVRLLARNRAVFVPRLMTRTERLPSGISTGSQGLLRACGMIRAKHARSSMLSPQDYAMMRYMMGVKLLLNRCWKPGMEELLGALRTRPLLLRAWLSLGLSLFGVFPLRLLTRLRVEMTSLRWSSPFQGHR